MWGRGRRRAGPLRAGPIISKIGLGLVWPCIGPGMAEAQTTFSLGAPVSVTAFPAGCLATTSPQTTQMPWPAQVPGRGRRRGVAGQGFTAAEL